MKIEISHRFDATHQHMTPHGMSEPHVHRWAWTVRLDGPMHPDYGWVADFDAVRDAMIACVADRYEATAEEILLELVATLAKYLPEGLAIVQAKLEEKPGQAAIWEA